MSYVLQSMGPSPLSAGNQHFHVDCKWPVWTGANHVREDLFPHRLTLVGGKRNIRLPRHARAHSTGPKKSWNELNLTRSLSVMISIQGFPLTDDE